MCTVAKANQKNIQIDGYEVVKIPTETSVADQKGEVPIEMVKIDITTAKAPN